MSLKAPAPASVPASASTASSSTSSTEDAQSQSALVKLGLFTVAMIVGPIGTYFLSLEHIWGKNNTTSAAISAAIVANLVVFGYIVTALREDAADQKPKSQ